MYLGGTRSKGQVRLRYTRPSTGGALVSTQTKSLTCVYQDSWSVHASTVTDETEPVIPFMQLNIRSLSPRRVSSASYLQRRAKR